MEEQRYRLTKKGDKHDNGTDIHNSKPNKWGANNRSTLKGYTLHNDLCYL